MPLQRVRSTLDMRSTTYEIHQSELFITKQNGKVYMVTKEYDSLTSSTVHAVELSEDGDTLFVDKEFQPSEVELLTVEEIMLWKISCKLEQLLDVNESPIHIIDDSKV